MTNINNTFEISKVREEFPILKQTIHGKTLTYFDNGATTQKPQVVIDAISDYYQRYNANVHRGVHTLSQIATDAQEAARATIQSFINAKYAEEIIFTSGTTESINLLAYSFSKLALQKGDEIILSRMEHHSNIVPWQEVAQQYGATIKVVDFNEDGVLDINQYTGFFNSKTKIVAITWVSNTLGVINPIHELIAIAHANKVPIMLDAAQAIQHIAIDVQALDVDFLVFSGHKIYAPTGIGVLYGKKEWLEKLPPYRTGGSMIKTVSFETTTYADLPFKFEAGTPHIAGIIGLGTAIDFVQKIGIENIATYENTLMQYASSQISALPGVRILAAGQPKAGALSMIIDNIHPFDIGELLDKMGIAVRTGHHCCQPIMAYYQIPGTLRASFALYNTKDEIDHLVNGMNKAMAMLQ